MFNGWDEGVAASELWKAMLTEQGYDVTLEYADPAPVYCGLASDDYDVTLDTWLPITHADYVEEYGDDIVDLGRLEPGREAHDRGERRRPGRLARPSSPRTPSCSTTGSSASSRARA